MNGLPGNFLNELVLEIFSHLSFNELLSSISLVNKSFKLLADDPCLLKKIIYKEKTFNPEDWIIHFGVSSITALENQTAWQSLPGNIGKIFKGACPIFPEKKLGETHLIVWIPANISINRYGELLKQKFPQYLGGYEYAWTKLVKQYGDLQTNNSEWVMMTRKILPSSEGKGFLEQQAMVGQLQKYTIPTSLEAIICISTAIFKQDVVILDEWYTRCKEEILGFQVAVNIRSPTGFYLIPSPSQLQDGHVAITCLSRFSF